jgi:tRNA wybutosine-synthesizing protein 5
MAAKEIPIWTFCVPPSSDYFLAEEIKSSEPVIFRGLEVGPCVKNWTSPDYLMSKLADIPVKVHVVDHDQVDKMDFRSKNFNYQTIEMHELIKKIFTKSENDSEKEEQKSSYYLRWVGDDPRGQTKANFHQDFPGLCHDFQFPTEFFFKSEQYFSSVLRLSSPGIRVWTHYDVMDNIYVQIVGHKSVILWPPNESLNLYLDGDKSKVVDLNDPHLDVKFPKFNQITEKFTGNLLPGDVLYIPALWFHNMKAIDTGVAINIFWKNLNPELYDKKDAYGNRDLLPAAKALRMLDNVWHQLDTLPPQYRDFYGRQLIARIESKCLSKKDITE